MFEFSSKTTISINTKFTEYDNDFINHPLDTSNWHHMACVYNGRKVSTYRDGAKIWEFFYDTPTVKNNAPCNAKEQNKQANHTDDRISN